MVPTLLALAGLTLAVPAGAAPAPDGLRSVVQDTTRRRVPPKAEPAKPASKPKPTGEPVLRRRPPASPAPAPPRPRPRPPSPIRP